MKPRPKKKWHATIDATELFESQTLKEFDFGDVDINQVQICEMGVKEVDGDIRYRSIGGFSLSTSNEEAEDVVITESGEASGNAETIVVEDMEADVKLKE
jgi:hypothetical protein